MKRDCSGKQPSRRSAPASTPVRLRLRSRPTESLRGMRTVETRAGDFPQHAGKAAAAPEILLVLLWAQTPLRIAALLRVGDGRNGDNPYREFGEDQFPHHHLPRAFCHAPN